MIYYGVQTESAILMRMNSIPRSVAESLGEEFNRKTGSSPETQNISEARKFLKSLVAGEWDRIVPEAATMSGKDYQTIWKRLSGEASL
jgi:hypothetical protein